MLGSVEILSALMATAQWDALKRTFATIRDHVSSNLPLKATASEAPKLTDADRRISMGLTKRNGELVVALLVEKQESSAEQKADDLATRHGEAAMSIVTGVAHS